MHIQIPVNTFPMSAGNKLMTVLLDIGKCMDPEDFQFVENRDGTVSVHMHLPEQWINELGGIDIITEMGNEPGANTVLTPCPDGSFIFDMLIPSDLLNVEEPTHSIDDEPVIDQQGIDAIMQSLENGASLTELIWSFPNGVTVDFMTDGSATINFSTSSGTLKHHIPQEKVN